MLWGRVTLGMPSLKKSWNLTEFSIIFSLDDSGRIGIWVFVPMGFFWFLVLVFFELVPKVLRNNFMCASAIGAFKIALVPISEMGVKRRQ